MRKGTWNVESPALGRLLIVLGTVLGGLLLLLIIPSAARSSEGQQGVLEGWQVVFSEDFSGGLGPGWSPLDANPDDGQEYTWGTAPFTYTSPFTSVWSVGGGADGSALVAAGTYTYPDNVDSWLIYGPITLTKVFRAELLFDWWLDSSTGDWFGWCMTTDVSDLETGCDEAQISGPVGTWISGTASLDLEPSAETPIYVVFHFTSNDDGDTGAGVFVDNVTVRADYGLTTFLPLVRRDPTPTPADLNYYESFDDAGSGWTTHQAACCLSGCDEPREHLEYKYSLYYSDGRYHVYIPRDCNASSGTREHGFTRHIYPLSLAPGVERPTGLTCVQVRGRFEVWDPYWSFWGLAFGANDAMSTVYTLEVNNLGDWAVMRRGGYMFPGPNHPYLNETRIKIVDWHGGRRAPARPGFEPNTLMALVDEDRVTLYINDREVHSFISGTVMNLHRVGILGGDWEIAPTQIGYDYFFVDEGCDDY